MEYWPLPTSGTRWALNIALMGFGIAFDHPIARGMFVHDDDIAIVIAATEEGDGVMVEAVIESGEPFDSGSIGEVVEDMALAAEVREELAGGDVPVAVTPGAFLPAGELIEDVAIFGVGEGVVVDRGRDKPGVRFGAVLEWDNVFGTVPGVADASGIGGGIDAGTPGPAVGPEFGAAATGSDIGVFA